jgi:hypothetical protein
MKKINNTTQRHWGKQRVKYTTHNEGNENQVCGKTRKNKWKMNRRWLEDWRTPPEQGEASTSAEVTTAPHRPDSVIKCHTIFEAYCMPL